MSNELGRRIAACRTRRSMTQEQLAKRLGVTRMAVYNWEHGIQVPPVKRIEAIAEVLGVTPLDLMK